MGPNTFHASGLSAFLLRTNHPIVAGTAAQSHLSSRMVAIKSATNRLKNCKVVLRTWRTTRNATPCAGLRQTQRYFVSSLFSYVYGTVAPKHNSEDAANTWRICGTRPQRLKPGSFLGGLRRDCSRALIRIALR